MTKEKEGLLKTLKDENLRAETRKFTKDLINNNKIRSLTVPNKDINNIKDFKNKINNNIVNDVDSNNNINFTNKENKNDEVKKKKKVKKKYKIKKGEKKENKDKAEKIEKEEKIDNEQKIDKIDKAEKIEKGTKLKLLNYKTLNQINNGKNENKEKEIKPIINDKMKEKNNNKRRDLLNSLNNLKYNFDNLMEIGVHGNKYFNTNNKK